MNLSAVVSLQHGYHLWHQFALLLQSDGKKSSNINIQKLRKIYYFLFRFPSGFSQLRIRHLKMQCCESGMSIPALKSEFFHPGSRF